MSTETDALFDDQMPTGPAPLASEKRGTSWPKIVALFILIAGLVWFRFLPSIKPKSTTSIDNASVTEIDFGNHDQLEARFNNNARAQFNVATTELTVSETGDGQVMSDFAVDAGTFLEQRMIRPSARADLVTSLRLYQTNPPKNLWQHITKDDRRPAFALSRDRSYFVAPHRGTYAIVNAQTGVVEAEGQVAPSYALPTAFQHDTKTHEPLYCLYCTDHAQLHVWDMKTKRLICQTPQISTWAISMVYIAKTRQVVICHEQAGLLVLDAQTGELVRRLNNPESAGNNDLSLVTPGRFPTSVLAADSAGLMWEVDIEKNRIIALYPRLSSAIYTVSYCQNQSLLLAATRSPLIAVFDAKSTKKLGEVHGIHPVQFDRIISGDEAWLVSYGGGGGQEKMIEVYSLPDCKSSISFQIPEGMGNRWLGACFNRGGHLLGAYADKGIFLIDACGKEPHVQLWPKKK